MFGRLSKWTIKLGQFDIKYLPRVAIKGQVLTDFVGSSPLELGQFDIKYLPRVAIKEQGCLIFTHKGEESSGARSSRILSVLGDPEVI